MAEWWELAIPVTGSIASGLAGVWVGSHFQLRNSLKLLERQAEESRRTAREAAEEAERVRREAAEEAKRARTESYENERLIRLTEKRREVYVRLLRTFSRKVELTRNKTSLQGVREELTPSESERLAKIRDEFTDLVYELWPIASPRIRDGFLRLFQHEYDFGAQGAAELDLVALIREELGVPEH